MSINVKYRSEIVGSDNEFIKRSSRTEASAIPALGGVMEKF